MTRMVFTLGITLIVLGVSSPALAGGGGWNTDDCRGFSTGQEIVLLDSCFDGIGHVAEAGAALRVRNDGEQPHTLTAVDRSFDTGILEPGEEAEIELADPAVVPIYCTLHASDDGFGMAGLLVVTDGDTGLVGASIDDEPATDDAALGESVLGDPTKGGADLTMDGAASGVAPEGQQPANALNGWMPVVFLAVVAGIVVAAGRFAPRAPARDEPGPRSRVARL